MLTIFAALLLAQAEAPQTLSAANSVAAAGMASATATATVDAADDQEICRTRFRRSGGGTNLVNGNKSYKVCKTKAEWAAKGAKID